MNVHSKRTLMIVDDDRDDVYFFLKAVNKLSENFECRVAGSGTDALKQLRHCGNLPDFIFLDLNMPCMNGMTCIEELKKDIDLRGIPVIIYSTSNSRRDIEKLIKLGAAYYMPKPLDVSELPEKILQAIESVEKKVVVAQ